MRSAYVASKLPIDSSLIDGKYFYNELIDAVSQFEVYKEKIADSKLDASWFMPTLQQKEALASSLIEGTQATLDDVLIDQFSPNEKDRNLNEIRNYYVATEYGYNYLRQNIFSNDFFCHLHEILMKGNVRKPELVGQFRNVQNYIGRNDLNHSITFVPPEAKCVVELMDNLVNYINAPEDNYRELVRVAIVHAQFETIHPFMDGNGRVGRILVPMYMFAKREINLPCFFISEALERDKIRYYSLLNNTREKQDWNEWIRFFLKTVAKQCRKYIELLSYANNLYDSHLNIAREAIRASNVVDIIDALYKYPVINAKTMSEVTGIPISSVNRYLAILVDKRILFSDNKKRNKMYFYADLLSVLR